MSDRSKTNFTEQRANGAHGDRAMNTQEQPTQPPTHVPELIKHQPPPKVSRASVLTPVVIVFVVTVVLAIVGIIRRQHASTVLANYTDTVSAPTVSVEQPVLQQSAQEIVLARQHAGLHSCADLRANDRLCKGLVPRHRLARQQRRSACSHRDAGVGSATRTGQGRPRDCPEQRRHWRRQPPTAIRI